MLQLSILSSNKLLTMSSREIAELINKNHADALRDIRNISDELGQSIFAESSFIIGLLQEKGVA
jgi:phage regulator Rha-like protein